MPSQRRSSRRADRCSLQSLDLVNSMQALVLDEQQPARTTSKKLLQQQHPQQYPQQQQQQPRRSKRIQELNAKKQSLLPSSPVSTIDTPSSSIVSNNHNPVDLPPKMAPLSIVTPIKTPAPLGVHFGTNSVAKFSGSDPPMHMERLSPNTSQQLFPRGSEEDSSMDGYDDETKQNCHILAQWDDSFDELDQIQSDDDESVEVEQEQWRFIVEEEEDIFGTDILTCPNVSHRSKPSSRPIKRVDEYFCKSCGRGMRRTSRYVYEED